MYIPMLQSNHPLFQDKKQKFTNTSLRKYHNDALSEAGAPIIVQQESLAQNTRAYAKQATASQNLKTQVSLPIKKEKYSRILMKTPTKTKFTFRQQSIILRCISQTGIQHFISKEHCSVFASFFLFWCVCIFFSCFSLFLFMLRGGCM